jgi:RNA polymerase sigma-70 factor (ECF subfamily)
MTASNEELVARAVAGDADALGEILERCGPEVRRQLAGSIPSRWQAILSMDDVMQQAYAEAFMSVRRFIPREAGSFTGWLASLARCNLIDAVRMLEADKRGGDRRQIHGTGGKGGDESYVALIDAIATTTGTPSRAAAHNEGRDAIRRAVERLPDAQRRVVELYDLEGHSADEVAIAIGRSVGDAHAPRPAHRSLAGSWARRRTTCHANREPH